MDVRPTATTNERSTYCDHLGDVLLGHWDVEFHVGFAFVLDSKVTMKEGKVKVLTFILAFLLCSLPSEADELFAGYGLGIFRGADSFFGQTKYADLGYRDFLWNGIYWQSKLGYIGEGSPDLTRKSGGWGSTGFGLESDLNPVELRGGAALAFITTPDSQLGAVFPQFNEDISIGFRDKTNNGIALQYNHISCATFCSPNLGRDFVVLELSIKFTK